jgi:hypothetical protein
VKDEGRGQRDEVEGTGEIEADRAEPMSPVHQFRYTISGGNPHDEHLHLDSKLSDWIVYGGRRLAQLRPAREG